MRKYINIILLAFAIGLFSCEKFLEPNNENNLSEEQLLQNAGYIEGILLKAYVTLPVDYDFASDIASDDAVTNDLASSFRRMAIGEWKSTYNPLSEWTDASQQIYYLNRFLSLYGSVNYATDRRYTDEINAYRNILYKKRLKGEAYGLRAYYKWLLLQNHAGKADDGTLLGFPIINTPLSLSDNWKLPRNTFAECVKSIMDDCDTAVANLPAEYADLPTGGANPWQNAYYNLCMGKIYENRMNGNAAWALKARVALLAASPAFSASSGVSWEDAAEIAGSLLKNLGSLYTSSATSNNVAFYLQVSNKEMIWNRAQLSKRTWEQNNFPPSLYGNGRTNPSQSLVDAFPMKNGGYPIGVGGSGYNENLPYAGRDNRFAQYVVYNTASLKGTKINTYQGASPDGINFQSTSTRTGYYLKKFMDEKVSLNPSNPTNSAHVYTLFRMTEVLLNYCEAANEAWGSTGDPLGLGFTAKDKITECRARAGISPDTYLASLTSTEQFRELIRNERRISLCFEGFRFWDIRRWGDVTTMRAPVRGVYITQVDGVDTTFNYNNVEERKYEPDMIYGPVPFEETLKYGLEQNKGW